jgi:hypothetical protein
MADKADDIRQAIRKGRQEIADTRSAMTEKRALLEDRIQKTVDGVKHTFDLHYQVKQRPWLMFGGSLLAGYALGRRGSVPSTTADRSPEPFLAHAQPQSTASDARNQIKDDLATIKGAFIGAVISTLWAMAKQTLVPPDRPIDSAITQPGAEPSDSPQKTNPAISSNGRSEL